MKIPIAILLVIFSINSFGQVTFTEIPLDNQLIGRDINTNTGTIIISGQVNNQVVNYENVLVEVYRDDILQNSYSQLLNYTSNIALFNFNIAIVSELANYSLKIYGVLNSISTLEKSVDDIVAGDVYIIQGQSNAEAEKYNGSANSNQSNFIRVYSSGTPNPTDLVNNDAWYIGQGDGRSYTDGNTGQWGLKLARMLVDSLNIPIAIFNGAHPGRMINFFPAPSDYQTSLASNYGRLYYRLNKTGLKDFVRAAIWSQGESDGEGLSNTPLNLYKSYFLSIKQSWLIDYPNIEKVYIFQTKNGCGDPLHQIKEAQRQIAFENDDISIMSTAAAIQNNDNCHFVYTNGYELFGERLFYLVKRDIYNIPTSADIDAPMILSATLVNDTTLTVKTNASSLSIDTVAEDFLLENAGSSTITNITTSLGDIIFTLSENPGQNATISYLAQGNGPGNFITNQNGIEILCFDKYPIKINGPLLITQYYEGIDDDDKWIEVKNITSNTIQNGDYYLALYTDLTSISIDPPAQSIPIDELGPGEVVLYRNSNASLPSSANLGSSDTVDTLVCSFDGDDVIIISSSAGSNCFNDRIDMIGFEVIGMEPFWGADISLIKGAGTTEIPSITFNPENYLQLSLDEVNTANPSTNISLGTQTIGPTIYSTSWSNGIPDKTKDVVITGNYAASNGSIEAGNLTINGTLDMNGGTTNYVKINNNLTITGDFTIGDTESLLMNDATTVNGIVSKLESSNSLNNFRDFTYWSSPIHNATIEDIFVNPPQGLGVDPNRIFEWEKPSSGSFGSWQIASGAMEEARGYISEAPNGTTQHNITFNGVPRNGPQTISLGYDPLNLFNGGGFNLIGNPYPSALDAIAFINENVGTGAIDGTLWFWTHYSQISNGDQGTFTIDDYATFNLTGGTMGSPSGSDPPTYNIGSSQGFFVRTTSSNNTASFTNSMRLDDENDQFFRSNSKNKINNEEKDRIWLDITSQEGGAYNQLLIGFFEEATEDFDEGYDGIKFNGGNYISFYSKLGDDKYAIQGLGPYNSNKQITLGFDTYILQTFTISVSQLEGKLKNEEIYLVDHELDIVHDLRASNYTFKITETGLYTNRFTLQFKSSVLGIENFDDQADFYVISKEDSLIIKGNKEISSLRIFDFIGRLLVEESPNKSEVIIPTDHFTSGTIFLVDVIMKNGANVNKKAIKY